MLSIIILKHGKLGYVAELRFSDTSKDCSISADTHQSIYKKVEEYVSEIQEAKPLC